MSNGSLPDDLPEDLHELEQSLLVGIGTLTHTSGAHQPAPDAPLRDIFDAQVQSRVLDHTARWLRAQGIGYYTIGSAGHESNAAVAAALRVTDPALLHYRSGGFYCARAMQRAGHDAVGDVLSGMLALVDEPIAGGRHKVFGHHDLTVIPQTSTIASHLPRALGVAFAIGRARRLGVATAWPTDALAVCSFGDASANHSTAQGAINAACYTAHGGLPVPLLLVCEDNGWGISVPTPAGWIEATFSGAARAALRAGRRHGSGCGVRRHRGARCARACYRQAGAPAPPHRAVPGPCGHRRRDELSLGSVATSRSRRSIRSWRRPTPSSRAVSRPPQRSSSGTSVSGPTVRARALELVGRPTLATADSVVAPLSPRRPDRVGDVAATSASPDVRDRAFDGRLPEDGAPLTLAETINRTLAEVLAVAPGTLVFGEDVGAKGGVYGVTRGLQRRFGAARVFDSLLDEQSILGLAIGAGVSGLLPIPEIQYLAYLHNAERSTPRRGRQPVVLLQRAVPQSARGARRRLRLSAGVRWPLPQRQRDRVVA